MEPSHYPPETYRYDRPAKFLQQIDLDGPGATNPREVFWAWVQGFGLAGVIIGYAFLLCAVATSDGELAGPGATFARLSAALFGVGMLVAHFASSRSWSITMDARDLEDHHGIFLACSRAAMTIRGWAHYDIANPSLANQVHRLAVLVSRSRHATELPVPVTLRMEDARRGPVVDDDVSWIGGRYVTIAWPLTHDRYVSFSIDEDPSMSHWEVFSAWDDRVLDIGPLASRDVPIEQLLQLVMEEGAP